MLELDISPAILVASIFLVIVECGSFFLKVKRFRTFLPPIVLRQAGWLSWVPALIPMVGMTILMRRWAKKRSKSIDQLVRRFSVRRAVCFCENDRAPVERNIVDMLKSMGFLARDGGHENGIDVFDELVRVHLPSALHTRYAYCDALIVGIAFAGEAFDSAASCLYAGEALRFLVPRVWFWIAWHTACLPLVLLTLSTLVGQFLALEGFYDWVYSLCIIMASLCVSSVMASAANNLRTYSATSDTVLFLFVLATVFASLFAYWMMGKQSMCWWRTPKHRTTNVESVTVASKLLLPLELGDPSGTHSLTSMSTPQAILDESTISSEEVVGETSASEASCRATPSGGVRTVIRASL